MIKEISTALKTMEPGAFQDFCLDFLPLFDPSYKGLERHGGTVEGKPRKGTPDLIKTLSNGKQIAVQCSVAAKYWKSPKDKSKFPTWKPCDDIEKCLQRLNNVEEIILCSNQEVPTNRPNAKTEILSYTKHKTNARITLLCGSNIENSLINNVETPGFETLFKKHFPKIHERIAFSKEAQANKLAINLLKERPVSLDNVLRIATDATRNLIDLKDAKAYALKKIDELRSKFEREYLPKTGNVVRHIPKEFPLIKPIGTIQALLGVPKIGKTSLIAQCASHWKSRNINIHWFDCPSEEVEIKSLVKDISRAIWASFLPSDKAAELANGIISLQSIDLDRLIYKFGYPTIYVVDNAEFLSPSTIKSLCMLLTELKSLSIMSYIGFLFVSNKSLKYLCPAISSEFSAPPWTRTELKDLLSDQLPEEEYYENDKYLEILETTSSGHPLVALALARKFPSIGQLVLSNLKAPSLANEDLAAEVKNLLFEDILKTDNDSLNYVLRLSPLVFKANDKTIYVIAKKINPVIATPFKLVLDRLAGTVIEGDERQGYSVSFVYKEVAKKQLSLQDQQEIYDIVSIELLTPEDGALNAIDVTNGVFYALLAKQFKRAFHWTIMLLQSTVSRNLPKTQIQNVIDRLEIVAFVRPPYDPKLLAMHYLVLLSMATAHAHIKEDKKAVDVLNKIKGLPSGCKDKALESQLMLINEVAKIHKMTLVALEDPVESIKVLSDINLDAIKEFLPVDELPITDLLKDLISQVPIKNIPGDILENILNFVNINDGIVVANLLAIALHLGVKAEREKLSFEEVIALLPSRGPIAEILNTAFKAQYYVEKQEPKSIELTRLAITLCRKNQLWSKPVKNILLQLQSDVYYKLNDDKNAQNSYLEYLEGLGDNTETFDYAWANYRLGLLSKDPVKAERYFRKSSPIFDLLGYKDLCARSEGERATALVQLDRTSGFVRIAEWMCRRYYLRNESNFGPAVVVIMGQLTRLICNLENKSVPDTGEKTYPKFERGFYTRVLDIAKPQTGGTVVFDSLARSYALLGNRDRKVKCLRMALSFQAKIQLEKNCVPLVIRDLLDEIIPAGDRKEIEKLIIRGIFIDVHQINLSRTQNPKDFVSYCIFSKLDNVITEMNDLQQQEFLDLLDDVEKTLIDSNHKDADWWLAEIYLRKAKIGEIYYRTKNERYFLWKKAYDCGINANNKEVIIQTGHYLGFVYCDYCSSMKSLADIQFNIVKSIPSQKGGFARLESLGQNLFQLWRRIGFRRLSISDLSAKQALFDSAKIIDNSGVSADNAGPIMILLLSGVYKFKGDATNWAVDKIKGMNIESEVPKDLRDKIDLYI